MTSGGKHRNARSTAQESETQKKAENPSMQPCSSMSEKAQRNEPAAKEDGGKPFGLAHRKKVTFLGVTVGRLAKCLVFGGKHAEIPVPWVIAGYSCSRECGKSQDECHWPGAGAECLPVSVVQQACPWSQIFGRQHCLGVFTYAGILVYICCYRMRSWNMDGWTKLSLVFDV